MPAFDIFAGTDDNGPLWVCAVEGLEEARYLLQKIAAEKPGSYFIISSPESPTENLDCAVDQHARSAAEETPDDQN